MYPMSTQIDSFCQREYPTSWSVINYETITGYKTKGQSNKVEYK